MPAPATVEALKEEADNYTYYGGGGCFGEFSTVSVENNGQLTTTFVKDVRKGDKILCA